MAHQQIYIEETIRGMKKAIARADNASDSDDSINQRTNRGNKLKRKSKYVQAGKLNNPNGPQAYKKNVEHAGYTREIISQNPMRFDEDGDEIEDGEISESAEINEDDPYSGIVLEDLLGPLTAVADLPKHPSLSIPYKSHAIAELIQNAAEMVRKESATLWRMKQLFTKLRGDETWAPCGSFETDGDRMIFAQSQALNAGGVTLGRRAQILDSVGREPAAVDAGNKTPLAPVPGRDPNKAMGRNTSNQSLVNGTDSGIDVHMGSATTTGASNSNGNGEGQESGESATQISNAGGLDSTVSQTNQGTHGESATAAAVYASAPLENGNSSAAHPRADDEELPDAPAEDEGEEEATTSSEPFSHRMTTRAQAKAPASKDPSSSPTISPETWIHPIFSVPASALPDKDFGLPALQADETRKLLMLYVQKQEEVVRGLKTLHDGLMRANRMKDDVFKWSKAEGHLGEMSDGEDWYDKEEWGLDADLAKGRDEDEDETNLPGKKTRQRRQ